MEQKQLIAVLVVVAVVAAAGVGAFFLMNNGDTSEAAEPTYTIKYEADGGDLPDGAPTSYKKSTPTFSLPVPTKDGYSFFGWYGTNNFTDDKLTKIVQGSTGNITLHARWQFNVADISSLETDMFDEHNDIKVSTDGTGELGQTILEAVTEGKTLTVETDENIAWTFHGEDTPRTTGGLNTEVKPHPDLDNKTVTLEFTHHGDLPFDSTVRYLFGQQFAGQMVTVENDDNDPTTPNEVIGPFEVDEDGYIEFDIDHCSNWIMTVIYTVSFDYNGGTPDQGQEQQPFTLKHGKTIGDFLDAMPVATKTGHTLTWSDDQGAEVTLLTTVTSDMTVVAKWTPIPYPVTVDLNGGTITSVPQGWNLINNVYTKDIDYGTSKVVIYNEFANAAKEGYTFSQYTADKETVDTDGMAIVFEWTVNMYEVTVDLDGGQVSSTPSGWSKNNAGAYTKQFDYGTAWDTVATDFVGTNAPTKTGHTYNSMAHSADTVGVNGLDLTAEYNPINYTVRFNANGGSGDQMEDQHFAYGESKALTANAYTSATYSFMGWSTSATSTSAEYTDGAIVSNLSSTEGEIVNLYAVWGPHNIAVTLTLDGQPYTGATVTAQVSDENPLTLTETGNGVYLCNHDIHVSTIYQISVNGVGTGYAATTNSQGSGTATIPMYTVHFDTNGGTGQAPDKIVANGKTVTEPANVSKEGHTLLGWATATGALWQFSDLVEGQMTLAASWQANPYTASVDLNGGLMASLPDGWVFGNGVYTKEFSYGTPKTDVYAAFTDATKTGHTYAGIQASCDTMGVNGMHIITQWTANTYVITFDSQGGSQIAPKTVTYGQTIGTIEYPTRNGYDDMGWFTQTNGQGTHVTKSTDYLWDEDLTLYQYWEPHAYSITYELYGGTNAQSNPSTYTIESTVALSAATRDDAAFGGWYRFADYSGDAVTTIGPREYGDITIYAKWTVNYAQVKFYLDGSLAEFGDEAIALQKEQNTQTMVKVGTGIYRLETSANFPIVNGAYDLLRNGNAIGEITVSNGFADARFDYYTVTFDANGASVQVPPEGVLTGSIIDEPANVSREGYTLLGWATATGSLWNFQSDTVVSTLTLVADWQANPYTATVDLNGGLMASLPDGWVFGNGVYTKEFPYGTDKGVVYRAFADAAKAGHTYAGIQASCDTVGVNGMQITAQWTANTYTITLDTQGGTPVDNKIVTYGEYINDFPETTKTGYDRGGWFTEPDGQGTQYWKSDRYMLESNLTLYMYWTAHQYTVNFDTAGGSDMDPIQATYGAVLPDIQIPTKTGYAFDGFFYQGVQYYSSVGGGIHLWDIASDDVTLTATWTPNYARVTIKLDGVNYTFREHVFFWIGENSAQANLVSTGLYEVVTSANFPIQNGDTIVVKRADTAIGSVTVADGRGELTINFHSVEFIVNQEVIETQAVKSGDTPVMPDAPVLPGRTFNGWTYSDGTAFNPQTPITAHTAAYAAYTGNLYRVNISNGEDIQGYFEARYGSEVEALANNMLPTLYGHTLTGIFLGNDQYFDALGRPMTGILSWRMTSEITLVGHFDVNSITLNFQDNGPALTATYGQAMPALSNVYMPTADTGYRFTGYFNAAEGGTMYYNADLTSAVQTCDLTQNTTMYPQYEKITYTLVYDLHGGSGNVPVGTQVQIDDMVDKPNVVPTRNGYTFNTWSLTYPAETTYFVLNEDTQHMINAADILLGSSNITVHALWTPLTYTITYDINGGSGNAPATAQVQAGAQFTAPEVSTTKGDGVETQFFSGWNTMANGQGVDIRGTATFGDDLIAAAQGTAITLYVKWADAAFVPVVGYTFSGQLVYDPNDTYEISSTVISVGIDSYRVEEKLGSEYRTHSFPMGSYPRMLGLSDSIVNTLKAGDHTTGVFTINGVEVAVDIYTASYTRSGDRYDATAKFTAEGLLCYLSETLGNTTAEYYYDQHSLRQLGSYDVLYRPSGGTPGDDQTVSSQTYLSADQLGISRVGYELTGWTNLDGETYLVGDKVTMARTVFAKWQRITNPNTNIEWKIQNQPAEIGLVKNGQGNAIRLSGEKDDVITFTGGDSWSYNAQTELFSMVAGGVAYRVYIGPSESIDISAQNGRPVITLLDPLAGYGYNSSDYDIFISFSMELPAFGQYVPTAQDVFTYNVGDTDYTMTVTGTGYNGVTNYSMSNGGNMSTLARGMYPYLVAYGMYVDPDHTVTGYTFTRDYVVFDGHQVAVYVVNCKQFEQWHTQYSNGMATYNHQTFYIGVQDGLIYRYVTSEYHDTEDTISTDTVTLVSKPANMNYIGTYEVTMQFGEGSYEQQSSLTRSLTGPDTNIIPQREGFDFLGWSLTQGGSARYVYNQGVFTPEYIQPGDVQDGAVTLYAVWAPTQAQRYTLTYLLDGRDIADSDQTFTENDQTVRLKSARELGIDNRMYIVHYYRGGTVPWHLLGEQVSVSELIEHSDDYYEVTVNLFVANTITLRIYGDFEESGYMTYEIANDGQSHNLPSKQEVESEFERQTYTATYLYTQSEGQGRQFSFGAPVSVEDLMAIYNGSGYYLYVDWEPLPLAQLRVHANNGTGDYFDGAVIPTNERFRIPEYENLPNDWRFDYDGFIEIGMSLSANGSDRIDFGSRISVEALSAAVQDGIVNLYFVWSDTAIRGYLVANFEGAEPEYWSNVILEGATMTLPGADDIGHMWEYDRTPLGFSTEYDGQVEYALGGSITYQQVCAIESHSLYVIWGEQQEQTTYTGVIHANNGTQATETQTFSSQQQSITLPRSVGWTYDGHVAVGFNTQDDGNGGRIDFGATVSVADLIRQADGNNQVHLYVEWEEGEAPVVIRYTVYYLTENGNELCNRSFSSSDSQYTLPSVNDFAGMGINANGIYTNSQFQGTSYEPGQAYDISVFTALADNQNVIRLYVRMGTEPSEVILTCYMYSVNAQGGYDQVTVQIHDGQQTLTMPENPSNIGLGRNGFTAVGYTTNEDKTGQVFRLGQEVAVSDLIALDDDDDGEVAAYIWWVAEDAQYTLVYHSNTDIEQTERYHFTANVNSVGLYDDEEIEDRQWSAQGFVFIGWNTDPEYDGAYYAPGIRISPAELIVLDTDENAIVDLYVEWEGLDTIYIGLINPNIQSGEPIQKYFSLRMDTIELPDQVPWTNGDREVLGLNTQADGRGHEFYLGEEVDVDDLAEYADDSRTVTLYVHWSGEDPLPRDLTINFLDISGQPRGMIMVTGNQEDFEIPSDETFGALGTGIFSDSDYEEYLCDTGEVLTVDEVIDLADEHGQITLYLRTFYDTFYYNSNLVGDAYADVWDITIFGESVSLWNMYDITSAWEVLDLVPLSINTSADGNGQSFELGAEVSANLLRGTDDHVLYIIWGEPAGFSIHLDVNCDTDDELDDLDESDMLFYDDDDGYALYRLPSVEDIADAGIENDGFMMTGWATTEDGTEGPEGLTIYASNGTIYLFVYDDYEGDSVTVYIAWEEIGDMYTVRFDINGGQGVIPNDMEAMEGRRFFLPAPTSVPVRMAFAGWNTQADGEGTHCRLSTVLDDNLVSLADEGVITLYAEWIVPPEYIATVGDQFITTSQRIVGGIPDSEEQTISVVVYADEDIYQMEEFRWVSDDQKWFVEYDEHIYCQGALPVLQLETQAAGLYSSYQIFGIEGDQVDLEISINGEPHMTTIIPYSWTMEAPTYSSTMTAYVGTEDQIGYVILINTEQDGEINIEKDEMNQLLIGDGNQYQPGDYTVVYHPWSGSETTLTREHQSVLAGIDSFDIEAPEGMVFIGWTQSPDYDPNECVPAGSAVVRMDHEVYAVWVSDITPALDMATVIIDGNGGSYAGNLTAECVLEDDADYTLRSEDYQFVRNGSNSNCFRFAGDTYDSIRVVADSEINIWELLLEGYEVCGEGNTTCYCKRIENEQNGYACQVIVPVGNVATIYMGYSAH